VRACVTRVSYTYTHAQQTYVRICTHTHKSNTNPNAYTHTHTHTYIHTQLKQSCVGWHLERKQVTHIHIYIHNYTHICSHTQNIHTQLKQSRAEWHLEWKQDTQDIMKVMRAVSKWLNKCHEDHDKEMQIEGRTEQNGTGSKFRELRFGKGDEYKQGSKVRLGPKVYGIVSHFTCEESFGSHEVRRIPKKVLVWYRRMPKEIFGDIDKDKDKIDVEEFSKKCKLFDKGEFLRVYTSV
jgi:hypothetical protein